MIKPRVVLIAPQVVGANQVRKATPPFGIACLAAVLEEKGYEHVYLIDAVVEDYDNVVKIEDGGNFIKFGLSDEGMIDKTMSYSPDVIGISSLFSSQTECALTLAKKLKEKFPKVPLVMGGNHASSISEKIIKNERYIDFVFEGEADYSFAEFLEKYFNEQDYRNVPGLVWTEGDTVKKNPRAPFIMEMDKLPFPAFHKYNMERYFEIGMPHNPFVESGRVGSIISSRGCPFHCYYCSVPEYLGNKFRAMSAKRVIEWVKNQVDRFNIKELQILDDCFTVDYKRVIEICNGIKQLNLRISFPNAIRADLPKDRDKRMQMFEAMRDAGVKAIGLAAEHGDQEFLNNVLKKNLNLDEMVASCDMAHKVGFLVHANFMIGFPFENAENRKRTIEFARRLDADSFSVSLVAPLPGTPLWNIVKENELFADNFNVNRIVLARVNIKPHDITEDDLYEIADTLNCELNEAAQNRRPEAREKYKMFKGKKAEGDRKYHFIEEKPNN